MLGYMRSDVLPNMPKHVAIGAGYNSTRAPATVKFQERRMSVDVVVSRSIMTDMTYRHIENADKCL